jgi:MFS family permease
LLPLTAGIVVGSTLNSRVSARTGTSGKLPPWGLGASAFAIVALALLPPLPWLITVAAAVCGVGFGTVMPSAQLATQILAGRERLGAAAALLSLVRSTGATLGTAAFGGLAFILLRAPQDRRRRTAAAGPGSRPRGACLPPRAGHAGVVRALAAFAAARAPRMDLRKHAAQARR